MCGVQGMRRMSDGKDLLVMHDRHTYGLPNHASAVHRRGFGSCTFCGCLVASVPGTEGPQCGVVLQEHASQGRKGGV